MSKVKLDIRRNVAGVFDSPPITLSTVVGSASLHAENCNRATLTFQFTDDVSADKFGILPLTRLAGGTFPCELASGVAVPPSSTVGAVSS